MSIELYVTGTFLFFFFLFMVLCVQSIEAL